jgi:DNA polymerase I
VSALYLIDVSALAYRSFYAFIKNPLKNSKGRETSAIFGFASHILRLIKDCEPTHIAFVKDLPKPTFRHEMYEDYKAHRKPMPDGLREQLPIIDQFVELSGLKTVSLEGFEADDVMATLAVQAKGMGMKAYIVSRDKDMMQLVDDSIFLFELGKNGEQNLITGAKEVKEKMGVPPEKIIDYLSLIGDASDNVPGVAKVGPKGACDLLETYGTLENIYKNVESITKKALKENLLAGRENAFLSKRLVILDTALKLPLAVDDLRYAGVNAPALTAFLEEWELKSLLRFVPGAPKPVRAAKAAVAVATATAAAAADVVVETAVLVAEAAEATGLVSTGVAGSLTGPETAYNERYELVNNKSALEDLRKKLAEAPLIAVDTETTGLDSLTADLVGICLSVEPEAGYYIPVGHRTGTNLDLDVVQKALKPALDDPGKQLLFHNGKYDLPVLERHGLLPAGLERPGKLVDTMIAAYLANPGERQLSLDDLSLRHFAHEMIPIEKLIGKGKNQKNFSEVPIPDACQYGAEDADITFRLWDVYRKELEEKGLTRLFFDMEMALLPVLMAMEGKGITLDTEALGRLSAQLKDEIARLEKEIHALAGEEFNIGSPTQLQVILFEKLRLKPGKKTKTGYSTDADVLAKLEGEHDIIAKLLDYRESTKLQSTYVEALPAMVNPATGRVHTSYSQVIAATGRLSSIDPNLQNIPVRTELGKEVRRCFTVSSPDKVFLCADYSQIELRLLAHLSGDPALKDAYRNDIDIHTRTAALIYKVAEGAVTSDMRRSAKVVNFGVLYGMGASRLSAQLRIPRAEASRFIENYFSSYSRVEAYIRDTVEKGRKQGYVETLAGRRRYLPDLLSDNPMHREMAEHRRQHPHPGQRRRSHQAGHAGHPPRAGAELPALRHAAPGPRRTGLRGARGRPGARQGPDQGPYGGGHEAGRSPDSRYGHGEELARSALLVRRAPWRPPAPGADPPPNPLATPR